MSMLENLIFYPPKYENKYFEYIYDINTLEFVYINNKQNDTILFFHGNSTDIYNIYESLINIKNYNVLCLEYPGYGKDNKRKPSIDLIMKEYYDTLLLLLKDIDDVIVVGHSMGTTIALQLNINCKAIVIVSAYCNISDVIYEKTNIKIPYIPFFDNERTIQKIDKYIIIVHGNNDSLVCPHHSVKLHNICKKSKLFILFNMEHDIDWKKIINFVLLKING